MRTASRGLIVAYGIIGAAWFFLIAVAPHVLPDLGKLGFVVLVGGPFIIVHGVALAVFCGSLVCAGRSLYREPTSRTFGGYVIFTLSALPALALGYLWFRGMVIGH
jgi:hypothetical protein